MFMSIRESMARRTPVWGGVGACMIVVALGIVAWQLSNGGVQSRGENAFYTIDDGQTMFVEVRSKSVPFEHNGKLAYRVHAWRCGDGSKVISHLSRNRTQSPTERDTSTPSATRDRATLEVAGERSRLADVEVRDPGSPPDAWFPADSPQGRQITKPTCADGSMPVEPIDPT
jgi:hypothetical protein